MGASVALGLALLIAAYFGMKAFIAADPRKLARFVRWGGFIVMSGFALRFLIVGRFDAAFLLFMFGLMLIGKAPSWFRIPWLNWPPAGGGWRSTGSSSRAGRKAEIETPMLRMTLDHDTGDLSGIVLKGSFKGQALKDLDLLQLKDLLLVLRIEDNQGAALLETFLDRAVGFDWREKMGQSEQVGGGSGARADDGKMTVEQALAVLGLDPGCSDEDIRDAHHRLMKKVHPDQGGSNYLAAQINQAKATLLKNSK